MSIDEIVRSWKSDEENQHDDIPENPIGEEMTEQELGEISGGLFCRVISCNGPFTVTDCFPFTD